MIGVRVNNLYNECLDNISIYKLFGLIGYKNVRNQPITLPNNVVSCLDFICQRSILKDDDRASLREFKLSKMIFSSCTIQEKTTYKSLTGNSLKEDFDNMDSYISHDGYVRIFIVKDKESFSDNGKFWIEAYNIYNIISEINQIIENDVYSIFIPEKFNIESNFISFLFEFCEIYLHHTSLIKNGIRVTKQLYNGREDIYLNFNALEHPDHKIFSTQQSLFIYYYYATIFRMMKQIIPDINEEDISRELNAKYTCMCSRIFRDAIVNGRYLNYNTDSSDNVDPDTIYYISRAFADLSDN